MTIDRFLKYIRYELNRSPHTVLSYSTDLNQFTEFITGGENDKFEPSSVTTNDIRAWLGLLAKNGNCTNTIRRKTQSLRAYYAYLQRHKYVNTNPAADILLAKTKKTLPEFIRQEEIEQLLDNNSFDCSDFKSIRNKLIVEILYTTGMRESELLTLTDSSIDHNRLEIKVTGKRNKQRIIPMAKELSQHIAHYQQLRNELYASPTKSSALIVGAGKAMSRCTLYNIVHNALQSTSTHKKSPHVLRHTFATTMLNNGAEINAVKDFLGHASLATTQIYTHVTFSELRKNYEHAHPRALKKGG